MADYSPILDEVARVAGLLEQHPLDVSPESVELIHDYVHEEDIVVPGLPKWSPIV